MPDRPALTRLQEEILAALAAEPAPWVSRKSLTRALAKGPDVDTPGEHAVRLGFYAQVCHALRGLAQHGLVTLTFREDVKTRSYRAVLQTQRGSAEGPCHTCEPRRHCIDLVRLQSAGRTAGQQALVRFQSEHPAVLFDPPTGTAAPSAI